MVPPEYLKSYCGSVNANVSPVESSSLEATFLRVASGARSLGVAWMVVLAGVVLAREPSMPVGMVAAAGMVWGTTAALGYRRRKAFATSLPAIGVDLLLACAAVIVGNQTGDSFWGGLPLVSVAIAAMRGRRVAWVAAGVLFVVVTGSVSSNPSDNIILDNLREIIFYGSGAFIFGWVVSVLRRSEEDRIAAETRLVEAEAERVRAEERAEISRHIHDSVLQTLALVQRNSDKPDEIVALARSQEHELRQWLFGSQGEMGGRFADLLRAAALEVEQRYHIVVDVVAVGDTDAGESATGLVAAAKEAMINAAVHGLGPISVFSDLADSQLRVFVRDRGAGFDLASVPEDRRGVSESIVGRMQALGGVASLRSSHDRGTEWQLEVTIG